LEPYVNALRQKLGDLHIVAGTEGGRFFGANAGAEVGIGGGFVLPG